MPSKEEKSSKNLLVLRSNDYRNRISYTGCWSFAFQVQNFNYSARLYDEVKGENAQSKVTLATDSLDISKVITGTDLKLDNWHTLFEGSETFRRSSETIKSEQKTVKKKSAHIIKRLLKSESIDYISKSSSSNIMVGSDEKDRIKLLILWIKKQWDKKKKRFINLHKIYSDPHVLMYSYTNLIKSKKISGKNNNELLSNKINYNKIIELSRKLQENSWKPGIAQRVMILKSNFKEFKPIIFLALYDEIVARAISIVLNLIYEKKVGLDLLPTKNYFHSSNHSFRPKKGCHSALNNITTWGLCSWFIKANIKKCYDAIDQKRLLSILNESIKDQILIDTLHKLLKIPIKNLGEKKVTISKGITVLQGNPLSHLLVNIYLNKFDQFMSNIKCETDNKIFDNVTNEWKKATFVSVKELSKVKNHKAKLKLRRDLYLSKVKLAKKECISKISSIHEQKNYKLYYRVHYVRYVNDYIIAVKGPKSLAIKIQKKTENFLKSNLHLNLKEEKRLFHGRKNSFQFLGFDIKNLKKNKQTVLKNKETLSFKKIKNRLISKKKIIETRYERFLFEAYKAEKLRILKKILKDNNKVKKKVLLKNVAYNDVHNLKQKIKDVKWNFKKEPFVSWLYQEYVSLKNSLILKNMPINLRYSEVINAKEKLLRAIDKTLDKSSLRKLKKEENKCIISSVKYNQISSNPVTCEQLFSLNPKIYAPIKKLKNKLKIRGMLSKGGSPKAYGPIFKYHDISIIEHYKKTSLGYLNYYRPAANFHEIKKLINYHLRWSLIHTLAGKHKKKIHEIISLYGKTPKIAINTHNNKYDKVAFFLSPNAINQISRGYSITIDPIKYWENIECSITKLPIPKILFSNKCEAIGCDNLDITMYYLYELPKIGNKFFVKSKEKKLKNTLKIKSYLSRKQVPLCKTHYIQWISLGKL